MTETYLDPWIVRSNSNGVMFRIAKNLYTIYNVREKRYDLTGTGDTVRKAWNRRYANSRQFATPNGVNHRFICK